MRLVRRVLGALALSIAIFALLQRAPVALELQLALKDLAPREHAQVFWSLEDQGDFQETDSVRFPVRDGLRSYTISIPLAAMRLRLDPRESPGPVITHDFTVKHALGFPILSAGAEGATTPFKDIRMNNSESGFFSESTDPILQVNFWNPHVQRRMVAVNALVALGMSISLMLFFFRRQRRRPSTPSSPHRWVGSQMVIVPFLAVSIGFLFCEGVFRWLELLRYRKNLHQSSEVWEPLIGDPKVFQWPTTWRNSRRNLSLNGAGNFAFHLNSDGFRGADWNLDKDSRPRILILGDSYTFGWGVQETETYPSQLQDLFRQSSLAMKVINAGVPGYGTAQEASVLRDLIGKVAPETVVLAVVLNDAHPPAGLPTPPDITYQKAWSWLGSELAERLYPLAPSFIPKTKFVPRATYNDDFFHPINSQIFRRALEEISALSEQHAAKLRVIILPDFTQEFDASYEYRPAHQRIGEILSSVQILSRDLLDHFEHLQSRPPGTRDRSRIAASELRIPVDGHPNSAGHAQIAHQLFNFLQDSGSLGPSIHR